MYHINNILNIVLDPYTLEEQHVQYITRHGAHIGQSGAYFLSYFLQYSRLCAHSHNYGLLLDI